MKKAVIIILFTSFVFGQNTIKAPSQPVKDIYFVKEIIDEYRNIENLNDSTVINWLKAEADLTNATLSSISGRNGFLNRLQNIDNKLDFTYGNYREIENIGVFYLKYSNKEKTSNLFFRKDFESEEFLLFHEAVAHLQRVETETTEATA